MSAFQIKSPLVVALVFATTLLASSQSLQQLTDLANSLRIERLGDATPLKPGDILPVGITLPAEGLSTPVTSLEVTREILWLSKDVLTNTFDPLDPFDLSAVTTDIVGRIPLTGVSSVPGKLNQLQIKELVTRNVPVDISVTWTISKGGTDLVPGVDYLLTLGEQVAQADILFAPVLYHDDVSAVAPLRNVSIKATVTLSVGAITTGPIPIQQPSTSGLRVPLPTLGIPKILALFEDKNFDGWVTYIVPSDSRLESANEVKSKVTQLLAIAGQLQGFARFVSIAANLNGVLDASEVYFHYGGTSELDNLNVAGWGTVEDRPSSMIFVGAPGVQVELYNKPDYKTGEGALTVFAPLTLVTKVRDLDNNKRKTMSSDADGCIYVNVAADSNDGFHDTLSSVSFKDRMVPFTMFGIDFYADEAAQRETCLSLGDED